MLIPINVTPYSYCKTAPGNKYQYEINICSYVSFSSKENKIVRVYTFVSHRKFKSFADVENYVIEKNINMKMQKYRDTLLGKTETNKE